MYYYHADGLGSIVALTNSTGTIVQSYQYDAFGNMLNGTPVITQPYAYTGREYDPETGLYYYRARYYDTVAGRFLQRDPISFAGGDVNLYAYVKNNPVNYSDPEGNIPPAIWGAVAMGAGFVAWAARWWFEVTHPPKNECELRNTPPDDPIPNSPGAPRNFPPYQLPLRATPITGR